jgi:hypothetical protein
VILILPIASAGGLCLVAGIVAGVVAATGLDALFFLISLISERSVFAVSIDIPQKSGTR